MCGIAGIVAKSGSLEPATLNQFRTAVKLSNHRGPDHFGEHVQESIALFHQRLSILDLDARSNQPFLSCDKQIISVYNGEVYNFKDLAKEENLKLLTTSDTEVLVELFSKYGWQGVSTWNGIFAFCALDQKQRKLTLARDRFGVKPLYYFDSEDYFVFASEAKVIYSWLPELHLDYNALSQFLVQGNTISSSTLISGVYKLEPGSVLELSLDSYKYRTHRFHKHEPREYEGLSLKEAIPKTKELLESAISRQLVADVPIGVFLSGGIDSSAITAIASRQSDRRINTYSVEFDFNRGGSSELPMARKVARMYNTNHHELKVESKDVVDIFERLVFQHDEPFSDAANIPLYLLTNAIKNDIKVVLQGDGGDEVFAGYNRYQLLAQRNRWYLLTLGARLFSPKPLTRNRAKRINQALGASEDYLKMALLTTPFRLSDYNLLKGPTKELLKQTDPFKVYRDINEKFKREHIVQRMLFADMHIEMPHTYLDKVDKSTMLNSIEARVPFLDNDLVDFVSGLPPQFKIQGGEKKYILRKALDGIVPDEILNGKKRGFGVPREIWLRESMAKYAEHKLFGRIGNKILNISATKKLWEEHQSFQADRSHALWKLLVLVVWVERYEDKLVF